MAYPTLQEARLELIESEGGNWIDGAGQIRNVKEMEYPHLINLAAWLERNSGGLHAQRLVRLTQMDDGGIKAVADAIAGEVLNHLDTGGFSWMIGTPFYRAVESEILHREKLAVKKGRTERKRRDDSDTRAVWTGWCTTATDTDTADLADLWRATARRWVA